MEKSLRYLKNKLRIQCLYVVSDFNLLQEANKNGFNYSVRFLENILSLSQNEVVNIIEEIEKIEKIEGKAGCE